MADVVPVFAINYTWRWQHRPVIDIAKDVVKILSADGSKWSCKPWKNNFDESKPNDTGADIIKHAADGVDIPFDLHTSNAYRGRLAISGDWPRDSSNYFRPSKHISSITVSYAREPKDIAREILNRWMPAYELEYRQGLQEVAADKERKENKERICRELAAILNDKPRSDGYSIYSYCGKDDEDGSRLVEVRVDSADSIQLKISADEKLATQILNLVMGTKKGGKKCRSK